MRWSQADLLSFQRTPLARKNAGNALACVTIAVGITCVRHSRVFRRVVEQPRELAVDRLLLGADEPQLPAATPSGRSVVSRMTSTGFPREGASSWMPPESVRIR